MFAAMPRLSAGDAAALPPPKVAGVRRPPPRATLKAAISEGFRRQASQPPVSHEKDG